MAKNSMPWISHLLENCLLFNVAINSPTVKVAGLLKGNCNYSNRGAENGCRGYQQGWIQVWRVQTSVYSALAKIRDRLREYEPGSGRVLYLHGYEPNLRLNAKFHGIDLHVFKIPSDS